MSLVFWASHLLCLFIRMLDFTLGAAERTAALLRRRLPDAAASGRRQLAEVMAPAVSAAAMMMLLSAFVYCLLSAVLSGPKASIERAQNAEESLVGCLNRLRKQRTSH